MKIRSVLLLVILTLIVASCAPAQLADSQNTSPQEPQEVPMQESSPQSPLPQPTANESPDYSAAPVEKFIDLTRNDLGKMLSLANDQITVLDTKEITWPNSALGCPAPGNTYAQGQVPGYQIHFEANNQQYTYHTDLTGKFLLCEQPNLDETNSSGSTSDPNIGVPIK